MKAEAGWGAAALVAVAAVVGINSQTGGRQSADTQALLKQPQVQAAVKAESTSAFESGPCGSLEGTIRLFLLVDKSRTAAPASCYGAEVPNEAKPVKTPAKPSKQLAEYQNDQKRAGPLQDRANSMQFVIAVLPDPLHTHFSLSFDREAEAIQQGAQDQGYFYDSSWLPWQTEEQPLALLADQNKAEDQKKAREEQPGILLFRKKQDSREGSTAGPAMLPYEKGLAVFIVGEEPTSGIHKHQFQNAVDWIEALQPKPRSKVQIESAPRNPVEILGPTFSGSLPSLAQVLADDHVSGTIKRLYADAPSQPLPIYSGSITSNRLVDWFTGLSGGAIGRVRFRSFQQDGDTLLYRYRKYLHEQKFEVSHLAIISEDETAYGGNGEKNDTQLCSPLPFEKDEGLGPTCLFYPRDLSALREAYQKQGIFNLGASQQSADASQRQLASDLADPEGKEHDTIRNYSNGQTALSQEAVLKQLVSVLRAHQAEYLVLRSSNPLDQIFLSYFLRMTYPEGRVVIVGSDLLLRRENGAAALSGIMTLTNYPMLPWESHWTASPGDPPYLHGHRVFAQESAEGTYVASRFLLDGDECAAKSAETFLPPTCEGLAIPDYAPPFWSHSGVENRPATWITVLGRDGFWPVAALPAVNPPAATQEAAGAENARTSSRASFSGWLAGIGGEVWDFLKGIGGFVSAIPPAVGSLFREVTWIFRPWLDSSVDTGRRPPWPAMPVSMKACMLALIALSVFHLFCSARPSLTVKPVHRANFARVRCDAGLSWERSHTALIVVGGVVLALIPTLLAWGYGEMSSSGEPLPHAWWYRIFLPAVWVLAGCSVGSNAWVESKDFPRKVVSPERPPRPGERLAAIFGGFEKLIRGEPEAWRSLLKPVRAAWRPVLAYWIATTVLYLLIDVVLEGQFGEFNRIPAYWRSINLTTGVSPLAPLLALAAGLYLWFWYSLQGLALFGEDRSVLPREGWLRVPLGTGGGPEQQGRAFLPKVGLLMWWQRKSALLRMFSAEQAAQPVEELCGPFAAEGRWAAILVFVAVATAGLLFAGGEPPIRSLGPKSYSVFFCLFMDLCISLMLANAWQLMRIWLKLSQLLVFLDRVPLRRTMRALQGISWGSIWKLSGSVLDLRYRLISRQIESLTHLHNSLREEKDKPAGAERWLGQVQAARGAQFAFAQWYAQSWNNWKDRDLSKLSAFQKSVAETAGMLLSETLVDRWRSEKESLSLDLSAEISGAEKDGKTPNPLVDLPAYIRDAEELVCLVYIGFIQNVLGRIRTLGMQILWLFVAATASIAIYPFDPRPATSGALFVLFLVLGATIIVVYSQMHRDATLSLITNTNPGELGTEFWIKLLTFAAGPALGLAATVFPDLTGSVFSWLQPGLAALK
jgi:hypothetical protein